MFTGIITHQGIIKNLSYNDNQDLLMVLNIPQQIDRKLEIGCSIACDGVCLTLVSKKDSELSFQISPESLKITNVKNWKIGDKINVEFALRMGDELGGHMVSGHVDAVVLVSDIKKINQDSTEFKISIPQNYKQFIASKGSIVLNGTSLTINEVGKKDFSINVIHHTFENANFSNLKIGDSINLEIDLIARYLKQFIDNK